MTKMKKDFEYFKSQLPNLLEEHRGQFALIKDAKIHGFFPSMEDALKKAYEEFDSEEFLIQEITDIQQVNYINSAFLDVQHVHR